MDPERRRFIKHILQVAGLAGLARMGLLQEAKADGLVIGQPAGETNAVLAGNNTDYSAGSDGGQGSGSGTMVWGIAPAGTDFTASATGTLRHGYLRLGSVATASLFRLGVFVLSSGTTYNLVEWSSEFSVSANVLAHVTFAGTNTITAGTHYLLVYIANGYMYTRRGPTTWVHAELSGGSYASPPTTLNSASATGSAFGQMEIYVTNYAI